MLFQDDEDFPLNQQNRKLSDSEDDSKLIETKSLSLNNVLPFEPSENSLLMDSDLLTQAVVIETVGSKASFCEEPIEAVTPQKRTSENEDTTEFYFESGITLIQISQFETFSSKVVKHIGAIAIVVHMTESSCDSEANSYEAETLEVDGKMTEPIKIFFHFEGDNKKVFFTQFSCFQEATEIKYCLKLILAESQKSSSKLKIVSFDVKKLLKFFNSTLSSTTEVPIFDLGLSNWVLNCHDRQSIHSGESLSRFISALCPEVDPLNFLTQGVWSVLSVSKNGFFISSDAKINLEVGSFLAFLALKLHSKLTEKLMSCGLETYLFSIELKTQLINHYLELTGFKFDFEKFEALRTFCVDRYKVLEDTAHRLVGKEFDLTSPDDVSFVVYFDLKLPPNGEMESLKPSSNYQKALGLRNPTLKSKKRNGKLKLPPEFNTRNETLAKLVKFHEVPAIVVEHRKVLFALSKIVSIAKLVCSVDGRVKPSPDSLSTTGRMSFVEPNIQNIPKSFPIMDLSPSKARVNLRSQRRRSQTSSQCINCRELFITESDCVLIGADYSQLELRLLAHFSGDETLLGFLNDGGDVFKSIAGFWKEKDAALITDEERQSAKQMCYGIIYGMGAKSLAEQLNTGVETAEMFIRSFRLAFPSLFEFVNETVEFCQQNEYIETLNGRRRYLPDINNGTRKGLKAHAERQAVNSRIQGSASEILKEALVSIRESLISRGFQVNYSKQATGKFCFLVLHLHDEVIYEVRKEHSRIASDIVRTCMERVKRGILKVKLPVKLKIGASWGDMNDLDSNN